MLGWGHGTWQCEHCEWGGLQSGQGKVRNSVTVGNTHGRGVSLNTGMMMAALSKGELMLGNLGWWGLPPVRQSRHLLGRGRSSNSQPMPGVVRRGHQRSSGNDGRSETRDTHKLTA